MVADFVRYYTRIKYLMVADFLIYYTRTFLSVCLFDCLSVCLFDCLSVVRLKEVKSPFMFKVCLLLSTTTRVQLSTITAAFIQQSLQGKRIIGRKVGLKRSDLKQGRPGTWVVPTGHAPLYDNCCIDHVVTI